MIRQEMMIEALSDASFSPHHNDRTALILSMLICSSHSCTGNGISQHCLSFRVCSEQLFISESQAVTFDPLLSVILHRKGWENLIDVNDSDSSHFRPMRLAL